MPMLTVNCDIHTHSRHYISVLLCVQVLLPGVVLLSLAHDTAYLQGVLDTVRCLVLAIGPGNANDKHNPPSVTSDISPHLRAG